MVCTKNIDSDDWVDGDSLKTFLQQLHCFIASDVDLVLSNYVYEHVEDNTPEFL